MHTHCSTTSSNECSTAGGGGCCDSTMCTACCCAWFYVPVLHSSLYFLLLLLLLSLVYAHCTCFIHTNVISSPSFQAPLFSFLFINHPNHHHHHPPPQNKQGLHFLVDRLRLALSVRPQQLPGNLRSVSEGFTPKASPKGGPGRSTGGGYTSRGPSATGGPPHTARRGGLARQLSADAVSPAHQASNPPSARETPRAGAVGSGQ